MGKNKTTSRLKLASKSFWAAFKGYDAIKNTRYRASRGVSPLRSEEIELNRSDRDRMMAICLEFRRNNPVVASLSRLRKADIIGRGIIPQPSTGDDDTDKSISIAWAKFSEDPASYYDIYC